MGGHFLQASANCRSVLLLTIPATMAVSTLRRHPATPRVAHVLLSCLSRVGVHLLCAQLSERVQSTGTCSDHGSLRWPLVQLVFVQFSCRLVKMACHRGPC